MRLTLEGRTISLSHLAEIHPYDDLFTEESHTDPTS
jgi:hypothetical protein